MDDASPCLEELVASWSRGWIQDEDGLSLLVFWPWLNGSCVGCGRLGLFLWLATTARGFLFTKATSRAPRGDEWCTCYRPWEKQFCKALMRRKPDGVVGGRESAVLMMQVTTWRLGRTGLESLMAFHDLTNAFGSVNREAMDRAVASLLGPNPLIGKQRYRLAITAIPGRDGDITLKIGEGGLMRDPLMVALFWVAFSPPTIRWQQQVAAEGAESEQLLAWHPWSEPSRLWQIVAEQREDVVALARREQCSNDVF